MSRGYEALLAKLAAGGFLLILIVACCVADPLKTEASSVATPLGSSQLVASGSDREEGLEKPVGAPPTLESGDANKDGSPGRAQPPPASEVGDMMRDPYHNVTSTSDRDEEAMINNDTDIVHDSHVNPLNKTHEEEASNGSTETPLDGTTRATSVQDGSTKTPLDSTTPPTSVQESSTGAPLDSATRPTSVQDGSTKTPLDGTTRSDNSPALTTESSTTKVDTSETEIKEDKEEKEHSVTKSEEMDVTEKVAGEVSLAEVTSLPVGALVSNHDDHQHPNIGRTSSLNHTTEVAAILAGVLVLVALMGYLGLLMWRRVLERRYGNREMLVNEDDDFKHFEL